MDPVDFLNVSLRLHASALEEDRRTAISRSYYALYLVLHMDLRNQGVQFTKGGKDHRWMVYYLLTCADANASRIGQTLKNLQTDRNKADYSMNARIPSAKSEFAYRTAQAAVQLYRGLNPTALNAMVQAIKHLPPPPP